MSVVKEQQPVLFNESVTLVLTLSYLAGSKTRVSGSERKACTLDLESVAVEEREYCRLYLMAPCLCTHTPPQRSRIVCIVGFLGCTDLS